MSVSGAGAAVRDEVVDRVSNAGGVLVEGLSHLKVKHLIVFPTTWLLFFFLGRWFFDNVLGRYHATSSRYWALGCKLIFLVTFVSACNLLQLMIADVYGFMHPSLRIVAWTSTLSILCFLLNGTIPFMIAVSMGRTLGLPRILAGVLGMGCVLIFQLGFWFVGETLLSDMSETWKDHHNVLLVIFLYKQLFLKDLEHSVAIVAMMGTFTSAMIAGFATVSFPMDQLMIFRGVNEKLLRAKERTHIEVLSMIAAQKRELLLCGTDTKQRGKQNRAGIDPPSGNQIAAEVPSGRSVKNRRLEKEKEKDRGILDSGISAFSFNRHSVRASINYSLARLTRSRSEYLQYFKEFARVQGFFAVNLRRLSSLISQVWWSIDSIVDHVIINTRRLWAGQSLQAFRWRAGSASNRYNELGQAGPTSPEMRLLRDIPILEQLAEDIFRDIAHSHELQEQAEFAATKCGKAIWWCGVFLSGVGTVRLYFALSHIAKGFFYTYISEPGTRPDPLTSVDIFLQWTELDPAQWAFPLNITVICFLGAFQIRALLGSMMIAARLGFLSTNTELYALVLAYMSGFYFIASIVLLRTELPIAYRKGVTMALGQFSFDYFEWLFDRIYLTSAAISLLYLWGDARRKKTLSKRFFLHDG